MKLIKRGNNVGIDKKEFDKLIAAKNFIGLNKSPRAEKVIVSLTSYKPRINDVKYAIYSLLNQSFPPDKLILWLDEDSFPQREKNLPRDLLKFRQFGLTINWCENLRSYKKLIPALKKYPDDIIVTADDDIFYRPDWLKILYDEHTKNPNCIVAHYGHRMRIDTTGKIYSYKNWHFMLIPAISLPPMLCNSFGSGGGLLLKRSFFHADILNRELFLNLAPIDDELWVWAMAVLNGTKIKIPLDAMNKIISVDLDTQENGETLWNENKVKKDIWLKNILEHYPVLLEKLIRETVDSKPYISVVVPIKNSANLTACIENIFWQKFPDFELLIVNCGARVNLPPLPTNFRVINYPGESIADALNLGLRKAAGDYVLFMDEKTFLPKEALDIVAKVADDSKADVIHFAGHLQIVENSGNIVIDDAPELRCDRPILFDSARQMRSALWLQNKLSRRLETKIFRRDFLTKHGLTFDNDITEFLFQTLVDADQYLLVPQAFSFSKE